MPLPGTRVIPPGWSEHHRPTATSTMTATCVITRAVPGAGTTDAAGTWTPPTGRVTVYDGPCRVTSPPFSREQLIDSADAQVTRRRYSVFVEWDAAEFAIGDLIQITDAVDPGLAGKAFRLVDIAYGSEQWQRNLFGEEIEGRT